MIFGGNKRQSNQEVVYLDKDQIKISHEYIYIYLGIDFHYFEVSNKSDEFRYESLVGTLRK